MIINDPERHLVVRTTAPDLRYPGFAEDDGIYGLFCAWYNSRSKYRAEQTRIDAFIKARYLDGFDLILPAVCQSVIHTIFICVEYPQIRRKNKTTAAVSRISAQYQVQLQHLSRDERCAAVMDAVIHTFVDIMRSGNAYGWVTRLRQRLPYAFIRACIRDA